MWVLLIAHFKENKKVVKAISLSAINQILSSGTNFVLGIYLVRALSPADFGLYGIGFAISLFYSGIGNALFLIQMVVHIPDKALGDRRMYAGRILVLVTIFCAITIFLVLVILMLSSVICGQALRYANFASAIMVASVAYLLKDFFVRHAYSARRESWALSINAAIAIAMAVLLWFQHHFDKPLKVEEALWIYAAANATGAILGCSYARLPFAVHRRTELLADFRGVWHGGKWASITNFVSFARTQAHTIVAASLLGPVGVAKLNAARLLVTPSVMLTPAVSQVALPRMLATRGASEQQLMKLGRLITGVLFGIAFLYSALLLIGYDYIVEKILHGKYGDLFFITCLWCTWGCITAIRNGVEMTAQALKHFKKISGINTIGAIFSLVATYIMTSRYGLPGALIGIIAGEFFILICYSLKKSF